MNFLFPSRLAAYALIHTSILFLAGIWALSFSSAEAPLPLLAFLIATILLMRDALGFFDAAPPRRAWVLALGIGAVAAEFMVLLALLPLGFVDAAVLLALVLFLARDGLLRVLRGEPVLPYLFRELALFVVLTTVVFAVSRWSI